MGQVRDNKFGTDVSNETLLNATKYHAYSLFWVIKTKPTGGEYTPPNGGSKESQGGYFKKPGFAF